MYLSQLWNKVTFVNVNDTKTGANAASKRLLSYLVRRIVTGYIPPHTQGNRQREYEEITRTPTKRIRRPITVHCVCDSTFLDSLKEYMTDYGQCAPTDNVKFQNLTRVDEDCVRVSIIIYDRICSCITINRIHFSFFDDESHGFNLAQEPDIVYLLQPEQALENIYVQSQSAFQYFTSGLLPRMMLSQVAVVIDQHSLWMWYELDARNRFPMWKSNRIEESI